MAIRIRESEKLRERWGNKPCTHPEVEKEIDWFGNQTGDVICTQCGAAFFGKDTWREVREKILKANEDK